MITLAVWKYLAASLLVCRIAESQEIQGRVNVGSNQTTSTSQSFVFTLNVNSGNLPVYFDLYNVTDGATVDGGTFDEDVDVSCMTLTPYTPGDAVLTLASSVLPLRNGITVGQVSFDIVVQGRRVEVQCVGESSLATPATTSYFSLNTSAGMTGFVTVKKSPVVSLCSERILVANSDAITSGQITVRVSEPVQDSNVTVKCEVVGVSEDDPTVWLAFTDVRLQIGEDTATMTYDITGKGNTLQVNCTAESDDNLQYRTDTSGSGDVLFEFETGSVRMLPTVAMVMSERFTPLLVLSEPLRPNEANVVFYCAVTALNSTKEAQSVIDQGGCVVPDQPSATTPLPVTIAGSTAATTDIGTTGPPPDTNQTSNATTPMTMTTQPPLMTTIDMPASSSPLPSLSPLPTMTVPPVTTPMPANDTLLWEVDPSQIVFVAGDVVRSLDVHLANPGNGYQGFLLVRCCATPELNTSPKYSGLSASVLATVDVAPARPVNWTQAAVASELGTELSFGNPAYVEVAPCPCDLTANTCDVNCCCDQLCFEGDNSTFSCLPGIAGGDFTRMYDYACPSTDIYKPDYSPFLCVFTDNSPYLGLYFTAQSGARDSAAYNALRLSVSSLADRTSFEDSGKRALELASSDADQAAYRHGYPVATLFESGARGSLALPATDPVKGCSWGSQIRFQMDASSRCTLTPDQGLCSESSQLSARAYVLSTHVGYPPCPEAPVILAGYAGNQPAPTTVRYYCLHDATPYLVANVSYDELYPPRGESLFPESYGNGSMASDIPLPDRCDWDDGYTLPPLPSYDAATNLCSDAVLDVRYQLYWSGNQLVHVHAEMILGPVALTAENATRTPEGDEQPAFITPPPTTTVITTTMPPTTVAMETNLTTAQNVTEVNATTNVPTTAQVQTTAAPTTVAPTTQQPTTQQPTTQQPTTQPQTTTEPPVTDSATAKGTAPPMTTETSPVLPQPLSVPREFTQRFQVTFAHVPTSEPSPDPTQPPAPSEPEIRSGNPGYVIGRPVLSGRAMFEPLLDCNETGECIPFEPTIPGDILHISDVESNRLRVWLPGPGSLCSQSSLTDVTFGEDHISGCVLRLGLSSLGNCSILRETMLAELMAMVAADSIGKTGNASISVPSDWAPIFNSEDHPIPTPTPVVTTTDVIASVAEMFLDDNITTPRPLDFLRGRCHDVPTSANMEILYAHAGEINGIIQREIVSAYVTFTRSTVQLKCVGAYGVACRPDDTSNDTLDWVQSFPIVSTVVFNRVRSRDGESWAPFPCGYDMCNEEYIFPLTGRFTGDPRPLTMAILGFLTLLFITYVSVTKPWLFQEF